MEECELFMSGDEMMGGDYTRPFTTDEIFSTRDDLLEWVRSIAFGLGFVAVILRSDKANGHPGRKTFVLLGCERSGKYRKYKHDLQPSITGTRKCYCPFKLRGKPVGNGEGWQLKVICGTHNHNLSLVGHSYASRLKSHEHSVVVDMTKSPMEPANVLLTLKENNEDSVITSKQVYNASNVYKRSPRGCRTEMQQLMMLVERDNYVHWSRCIEYSDVVNDIFWTHPEAIKLLNAFNIVLLMDNTYKTNKYRLPLLEIVGVTSTGLSFSAAFVLLSTERENNFIWALERLRGLFLRSDAFPKVIISDKDQALINAISTVFPESYQLLCRFHINKNVKAKCKMLVDSTKAWDVIMDAWGTIMDCADAKSFDACVDRFKILCTPWSLFFEYVNNTWVIPHKEKFVKAWTDQVMHLGNTTTNRVEYAHWHWQLKRVLQNSMGDLCSCWGAIHSVVILQYNEIKASFEQSLHVMSHAFKVNQYKRLVGCVSKYALLLIAEELDRVKHVGYDSERCGCVLRRTHGLPCACELAKYDLGVIPLSEIHIMWTRLSFSDLSSSESASKLSIQQEFDLILNRFKEGDIVEKMTIKHRLKEIACPNMTSMVTPIHKVKTNGSHKTHSRSTKHEPSYFKHVDALHSMRGSCSTKIVKEPKPHVPIQRSRIPMLDQFHTCCHPYIIDVVDVKANGHCGYRCIASMLGMGEESWPLIRADLFKELSEWRDDYATLLGSHDRVDELKMSLLIDGRSTASTDKWMIIPDMGYVIASRYNVVLVCLSVTQNITIFPLRSSPPSELRQHRLISIGHVHDSHFVQVKLQDGCPIPMVDMLWSTYCYPAARAWSSFYVGRMQLFVELMGINHILKSSR